MLIESVRVSVSSERRDCMINPVKLLFSIIDGEFLTNTFLYCLSELQLYLVWESLYLYCRDSWVFIGQKGLKGKSLFEQLVPKKLTQSYAMSAAIQTCVPKVLPVKAWVDTLNDNLALFCEQQVMGYESVCAHNMTFPVESKVRRGKIGSILFIFKPRSSKGRF